MFVIIFKALAMVEEECRRYRPTKNYLENAGPEPSTAFETAAIQREMERVQQRLPMEPLSMKRCVILIIFVEIFFLHKNTILTKYILCK